jgi:hypothetical protein
MRGKLLLVGFGVVGVIGQMTGIANASPYCFETGPGYQKCVDGSTGGYLDPIYQGPKVYDGGNVPWVPSAPAPAYIPTPPSSDPAHALDALATEVLGNIQGTLDADPANAQFNIRVLQVELNRTGDTTFEGTATMTAGGGPPHDIPVHVFNTDNGLNWKIDPGVMQVLVQ